MANPLPTKTLHDSQVSSQVVLVLRNVMTERYPDLGEHIDTVSRLSEPVARAMGLPDDEVDALAQAALLHDIGKLALPETILASPKPLDQDGWRLMRLHTITGAAILAVVGLQAKVVAFVRSSHERFDGSGYPDGLAGENIPLGARVIAVCDAYDAMTSSRPYRPVPMSTEGASLELMRSSGTQFDSGVVDALNQIVLRHD